MEISCCIVGGMENELRLSPLALQTGLMRRWRAELATRFIADNVIAFHRRIPRRDERWLPDAE
jgi:hypothetical protein